MAATQQLVGINAIIQFTPTIFQSAVTNLYFLTPGGGGGGEPLFGAGMRRWNNRLQMLILREVTILCEIHAYQMG